MKITIKTLQQKVFQIDAEGTDTVANLKEKISSSQGHPGESQKLIYSGKVLPDNKTVEELEIKEKDFLVLMVSKPKATPAASTSAAAQPSIPAPAPATETPPSSTPAATSSSPADPPQPPNAPIISPAQAAAVETPAATSTPAAFGDPSSFLSGSALQTSIQNMVEMGFERDQVIKALKASYNNPDRAVEYLFNGIPAHLEAAANPPPPNPAPVQAAAAAAPAAPAAAPSSAPAAAQPAAAAAGQPQNLFQLAQQQQQNRPAGGAGAGGAGAGGLDLANLMNNPQIQRIRDVLQQNPEMAQEVIQQLAQENPQLIQALTQNPDVLHQFLGAGEDHPGQQVVQVTEEEHSAIQRLEGLGFHRNRAVQAFFICDKNEELAANYLFDNNDEDDGGEGDDAAQ